MAIWPAHGIDLAASNFGELIGMSNGRYNRIIAHRQPGRPGDIARRRIIIRELTFRRRASTAIGRLGRHREEIGAYCSARHLGYLMRRRQASASRPAAFSWQPSCQKLTPVPSLRVFCLARLQGLPARRVHESSHDRFENMIYIKPHHTCPVVRGDTATLPRHRLCQ